MNTNTQTHKKEELIKAPVTKPIPKMTVLELQKFLNEMGEKKIAEVIWCER